LVGGGALLPYLPVLAQTILGRPRVVLGKVSGLQGLPQIIQNPLYTNALGALKVLNEDMNESASTPTRTNGLFDKMKILKMLRNWV
jgi:cell division protein FtsA